MIRFYLGEEPLLANVPTYVAARSDDLAYVLDAPGRAGGQGGSRRRRLRHADRAGRDAEAARGVSRAHSRARRSATSRSRRSRCRRVRRSSNQGVAPRHIDLRPFVLSGRDVTLVPGGLTRVALREGSLVVNSSQGGGTKDTWVLE